MNSGTKTRIFHFNKIQFTILIPITKQYVKAFKCSACSALSDKNESKSIVQNVMEIFYHTSNSIREFIILYIRYRILGR